VPVSSEPRTDADPGHEAFAPVRFECTPSTWLAYLLVGYLMYVQASLGPILPFLREDLSLGYGAAGLHFGAFALGVLFTGFCASLLLMSAQAALSDLHGEWRAVAISEANVVAGAAAILAPLLVGAFSRTEFPGWRGALLFATLLLAAISVFLGRAPVPGAKPALARREDDGGARVLPVIIWEWCAVLFFCTAVEWSVALLGDVLPRGRGRPKSRRRRNAHGRLLRSPRANRDGRPLLPETRKGRGLTPRPKKLNAESFKSPSSAGRRRRRSSRR
jgi:hypothetical protein